MVASTGLLSQHIKNEVARSNAAVAWRFPPSGTKGMVKNRREYFIRSASLDRLRQFPNYLCTRSSSAFPNVLLFLNKALTAVQATLQQGLTLIQRYYLAGMVIIALMFLALQLVFCTIVFIIGSKPPGLIFMIASLLLMAVIAYRTFLHRMPKKRVFKLKMK